MCSWQQSEVEIRWGPGIVFIRVDGVHAEAVLDTTTWFKRSRFTLTFALKLHTHSSSDMGIVDHGSARHRNYNFVGHLSVP